MLTTNPFKQFSHYEQIIKLPNKFLQNMNTTNPNTNTWSLFETNKISFPKFDHRFETESNTLNHTIPKHDIVTLLHMDIHPKIFETLHRYKTHFKTTYITNNIQNSKNNNTLNPHPEVIEIFSHFDTIIESSKISLHKPDPTIYRLAYKQVDIEPTTIMYLNNLEINLKPTHTINITTIKVGDPHQTIHELETIIGFSLTN